jgi:hypothetical protein
MREYLVGSQFAAVHVDRLALGDLPVLGSLGCCHSVRPRVRPAGCVYALGGG